MKNVLNLNIMDRETFAENAERSLVVQEVLEQDGDEEMLRDLLADGFGGFYKYDPRLKSEVPAERQLNRRIISEMMNLGEYEELRNYSCGDVIQSLGSLKAVESMFKDLPDEVREQQSKIEDLRDAMDDFLKDADLGEESVRDHINELKAQLDAEGEEMETLTEAYSDTIRQAARSALRKATDEAEKIEAAVTGFGYGTDSAQLSGVSSEKKYEIARLLRDNPRLEEIMMMAGRHIRIAQKKQAEKEQFARLQISGVDRGNTLNRMLPSELLLLADDDLELLFLKKYGERALAQYKLDGKTPKGQGPIVVLVDCSGSMVDIKDVWAKAMTLALYWIARKQNRAFSIALFNAQVQATLDINGKETDPMKVAEFLLNGTGGGTSFTEPLDHALTKIESSEFNRADVIVITDGVARIPSEWAAEFRSKKEERDFSLYTILIGSDRFGDISELSDETQSLWGDVLKNEDAAFETAFNI